MHVTVIISAAAITKQLKVNVLSRGRCAILKSRVIMLNEKPASTVPSPENTYTTSWRLFID